MRPQGIPESPARVEFTVQFSRGPKGRRHARDASGQSDRKLSTRSAAAPSQTTSASRVPKITRLLVLGHHFERLVRAGVVKDYAEIARLTGLTRARITQIVNLTLLSPEIQEEIFLSAETTVTWKPFFEHQLRPVATFSLWEAQSRVLRPTGRPLTHQRR